MLSLAKRSASVWAIRLAGASGRSISICSIRATSARCWASPAEPRSVLPAGGDDADSVRGGALGASREMVRARPAGLEIQAGRGVMNGAAGHIDDAALDDDKFAAVDERVIDIARLDRSFGLIGLAVAARKRDPSADVIFRHAALGELLEPT